MRLAQWTPRSISVSMNRSPDYTTGPDRNNEPELWERYWQRIIDRDFSPVPSRRDNVQLKLRVMEEAGRVTNRLSEGSLYVDVQGQIVCPSLSFTLHC